LLVSFPFRGRRAVGRASLAAPAAASGGRRYQSPPPSRSAQPVLISAVPAGSQPSRCGDAAGRDGQFPASSRRASPGDVRDASAPADVASDTPSAVRGFGDQDPGTPGERRAARLAATMPAISLTRPSCLSRSSTPTWVSTRTRTQLPAITPRATDHLRRRVSARTPARTNRREESHPSPLRRHNADQRIWRARAQVRCRSPNDIVIHQIRKVQLNRCLPDRSGLRCEPQISARAFATFGWIRQRRPGVPAPGRWPWSATWSMRRRRGTASAYRGASLPGRAAAWFERGASASTVVMHARRGLPTGLLPGR
jgi:hypothetical protein